MVFYLTLTSVVFEYAKPLSLHSLSKNLTLTSVVFELMNTIMKILKIKNLTLTSVVFELHFGMNKRA